MLTRRNFISGTAAIGFLAFRNDTVLRLIKAEPSSSLAPNDIAQDEAYWAKVRQAFDVESKFLYLNNGGVCPAPRSVRAAEQAFLDEFTQLFGKLRAFILLFFGMRHKAASDAFLDIRQHEFLVLLFMMKAKGYQ